MLAAQTCHPAAAASVAYPKRHSQDDISDIYLLPAATRGVFVNIALQVRRAVCPALAAAPLPWLPYLAACRCHAQLRLQAVQRRC